MTDTIQRWMDVADEIFMSIIIALCSLLAFFHINDHRINKRQ